jgi:hypothetical protein
MFPGAMGLRRRLAAALLRAEGGRALRLSGSDKGRSALEYLHAHT